MYKQTRVAWWHTSRLAHGNKFKPRQRKRTKVEKKSIPRYHFSWVQQNFPNKNRNIKVNCLLLHDMHKQKQKKKWEEKVNITHFEKVAVAVAAVVMLCTTSANERHSTAHHTLKHILSRWMVYQCCCRRRCFSLHLFRVCFSSHHFSWSFFYIISSYFRNVAVHFIFCMFSFRFMCVLVCFSRSQSIFLP